MILLLLNGDNNPTTGDGGFEMLFAFDGADQTYALGKWNGSDYDFSAPEASEKVYFADGVLDLVIDKGDLGIATQFAFYAVSLRYEGEEVVASDLVAGPDEADLVYQLAAKKLGLAAGPLVSTPAAAVHGRPLTLRTEVRRTDTIDEVTTATATCKATLAGKPIAARASFARGVATCVVSKLPAGSKGKKLVVALTITFQSASVTKRVTATVR